MLNVIYTFFFFWFGHTLILYTAALKLGEGGAIQRANQDLPGKEHADRRRELREPSNDPSVNRCTFTTQSAGCGRVLDHTDCTAATGPDIRTGPENRRRTCLRCLAEVSGSQDWLSRVPTPLVTVQVQYIYYSRHFSEFPFNGDSPGEISPGALNVSHTLINLQIGGSIGFVMTKYEYLCRHLPRLYYFQRWSIITERWSHSRCLSFHRSLCCDLAARSCQWHHCSQRTGY